MADREKLIELIQAAKSKIQYDFLFGNIDDAIDMKSDDEYIADHLIANGVTVQKWIPVSERLPEDNQDVLAYMQNSIESRIFPANYHKGWWEDCIWNTRVLSVTHWMPLPEAPKGEGL